MVYVVSNYELPHFVNYSCYSLDRSEIKVMNSVFTIANDKCQYKKLMMVNTKWRSVIFVFIGPGAPEAI